MVRLTRLQCKGLLSFPQVTDMEFADNMVIVGPNNAGKSNIFRLLKILVDLVHHKTSLDKSYFSSDQSNSFLEVSMNLSNDETQNILNFLSFSMKSNDRIKHHEFERKNVLTELFNQMTIKLAWQNKFSSYIRAPSLQIDFPKIGLRFWGNNLSIDRVFPMRGEYDEFVPVKHDPKLSTILDKITNKEDASQRIGYFFNQEINGALSLDRISVESENFAIEIREYVNSLTSFLDFDYHHSHQINLSNIIGKIVYQGIQYSSNNRSNSSLTILDYAHILSFQNYLQGSGEPTFEENFNKQLMAHAHENLSDFNYVLAPDGYNLSSYLFSLKNSPDLNHRTKFSNIREAFCCIFDSSKLDFDVSLRSVNNKKYPATSQPSSPKPILPTIMVIDTNSKKEYLLSQVGSGVSEIIYILTLTYGKTNSVILLDEPSVNLHPNLMKSLFRFLQDLNTSSNQFLIITHSPELVHHEIFEAKFNILYLRKTKQCTVVKQLDKKTKTWFVKNRHKLKHQIDTHIFFGKSVILTEGESDKNILTGISHFYESRPNDIDVSGNDVIIIQVGGKGNFKKYECLMCSFKIPYLMLADSDARDVFKVKGSVTKDGIVLNGQILLIENGDLETLLESIDPDEYSKAKNDNGDSKPAVAYSFVEKITLSHPEKLKSIREILQEGIKLSNQP